MPENRDGSNDEDGGEHIVAIEYDRMVDNRFDFSVQTARGARYTFRIDSNVLQTFATFVLQGSFDQDGTLVSALSAGWMPAIVVADVDAFLPKEDERVVLVLADTSDVEHHFLIKPRTAMHLLQRLGEAIDATTQTRTALRH